MTGKIKAIKLS